jgi:hypothetical protein
MSIRLKCRIEFPLTQPQKGTLLTRALVAEHCIANDGASPLASLTWPTRTDILSYLCHTINRFANLGYAPSAIHLLQEAFYLVSLLDDTEWLSIRWDLTPGSQDTLKLYTDRHVAAIIRHPVFGYEPIKLQALEINHNADSQPAPPKGFVRDEIVILTGARRIGKSMLSHDAVESFLTHRSDKTRHGEPYSISVSQDPDQHRLTAKNLQDNIVRALGLSDAFFSTETEKSQAAEAKFAETLRQALSQTLGIPGHLLLGEPAVQPNDSTIAQLMNQKSVKRVITKAQSDLPQSDVTADIKSLGVAGSFFDFYTKVSGLDLTISSLQFYNATLLLHEYCPRCSRATSFAPINPNVAAYLDKPILFSNLELLDHGKCLCCHATKAELHKDMNSTATSVLYLHDDSQHSLFSLIPLYLTHRLLALGNVPTAYRMLSDVTVHGSFLGSRDSAAVWHDYQKLLIASDWFHRYCRLVAELGDRPLDRSTSNSLHFRTANLLIHSSEPSLRMVRGRTQAFSMLIDNAQHAKNGLDVNTSIDRSLLTVRTAAKKYNAQSDVDLPTGYFFLRQGLTIDKRDY